MLNVLNSIVKMQEW